MITLREAAAGIYGAWRLARRDPAGLTYFDISVEGTWRSFYAALIALPAYAGIVVLGLVDFPGEIHLPGLLLIQAISYVIDWVAFPVAAWYVAGWLDRRRHYTRLVVAVNWARLLGVAAMFPAMALVKLAPPGILLVVPLAVGVALMVYQWYVAKTALDISGGEALLVLIINVTISVIIALWAQTLLI